METVTQAKLDDMLRKVQALLAKADHPNTPAPEADTARNMAEALMTKYKLDETQIGEGGKAFVVGQVPTWRTFPICNMNSEFRSTYRQLASSVIHHVGIKAVYKTEQTFDENGFSVYTNVAECVGYESDLRMAELLFTSVLMAFQRRLEPKYDPTITDQENAYNMRSAGMEGIRIAEAIYKVRLRAASLTSAEKNMCRKVRAMFKAEAQRRGEDPRILLGIGNNVKKFREDFASGFETELWSRLYNMRASRGESEVGLVLASREAAITEAYYEKYPQFRPVKVSGAIGNVQSECAKCAAAKSGYCREHSYLRPTKGKERTVNYAAYSRGKDAARTVDLGKGGTQKLPTSNGNSGKEIGQ
jgi:hypothetical protein